MIIAIDCFKLIKGVGKSIGIYNVALNIVRELSGHMKTHPEDKNTLVVFGNSENRRDFEQENTEFYEIKGLNPRNKLHCVCWELFAVSCYCRKVRADRILYPRGYCSLFHPCRDYVLIHDMIPFYYNKNHPGYFNRLENAYITNRLRASAASAHKIITISEASKKDIISICRVKEEKISVIYNLINPENASDNMPPIENRDYICAITSALPHKNAAGILKSYESYCRRCSQPLPLKVIGIEDTDEFLKLEEKVKEKISCIKYIKDNREFSSLIAGSRIFLFLSLIEGFGLPPIEAMQLRVPVICSDIPSLKEVAGDAALLVNPMDPEQAASALLLLTDEDKECEKLIEKGCENIKRFLQPANSLSFTKLLLNEK